MKKLSLIICLSILTIFTYSFINSKPTTKKNTENSINIVQNKLTAKYGEEFHISHPIVTGEKSYGNAEWLNSEAYKIGEENKTFTVRVNLENPNLVLDNYETHLYQKDATTIYQQIASNIWPNSTTNVVLQLPALCSEHVMFDTAKEYLVEENPRALTRIYIGIDEYNTEVEVQNAHKFMDELTNQDLYGEIQFIYIKNSNLDDTIKTLSTLTDSYMETHELVDKYRYLYMKPNKPLKNITIDEEFSK